jgi:hypothetical protein
MTKGESVMNTRTKKANKTDKLVWSIDGFVDGHQNQTDEEYQKELDSITKRYNLDGKPDENGIVLTPFMFWEVDRQITLDEGWHVGQARKDMIAEIQKRKAQHETN